MLLQRMVWESDDGQYKVLVRLFEGDKSPMVAYWKLDGNGKKHHVSYSELPEYVLEKIEEMKSQIMFYKH